ncbi:helix-turn-helix domain-containing protein [Kosakonia sp. MUSA4]|uniref:helix-turn-helix domain-containing protein n=1 Tax=Kosakonia sp. MUSA4 TaxID=2067958 RepID=UPI0008C00855|nr:XRE family transcriptional regulator [Kosakonia sp. MUSA4]QJT78590.1 XRE family transcriptional regulator [Kosakonia sp. MUSA4]SEL74660.1 Predicted DNA-binding protein, contains XRE-type HTH domain [Kosakonia sacchari]
MKTTTENLIGHVTPAGANIFAELGFAPEAANALAQDAEREVIQLLSIKRQLMQEIAGWIAENHLKQAEVAARLNISRPRVSDVVNQKTSKFTIDALVTMLSKLGKPVTITVG